MNYEVKVCYITETPVRGDGVRGERGRGHIGAYVR